MNVRFFNKKTIHLVVWLCYLILLIAFYSNTFTVSSAYIKALKTIAIHAMLFYMNTEFLMPKLFDSNRYVSYFSALSILITITLIISYFFDSYLQANFEIIPEGRRIRESIELLGIQKGIKGRLDSVMLTRTIVRNLPSVVSVLMLSIVYKVVSNNIREKQAKALLYTENLLTEMKFLKSQINPHFLFNSLNNIYTLVHMKHDKAPAMLLKLSDMLRYMLYESSEDLVPLKKEVDYISNYIELQQLKTDEPQNIVTNYSNIDGSTKIPSLLLIPFIENSFKHSRIEEIKTGWISIHLEVEDNNILFRINNSLPSSPISKDQVGGIGLENVKRRLELLYPNSHKLVISKENKEFEVSLKITME